REHLADNPGDSRLEARIASYELAAKMQLSAPEVLELSKEPDRIHKLYGTDNPTTADFARNCLTARRMLERGVRFVQVWSGMGGTAYGESDEFSYQAVKGKAYCYDLHATILHLLGIDHEKLTFRHNGIDRRLTDVHGKVIREVLA